MGQIRTLLLELTAAELGKRLFFKFEFHYLIWTHQGSIFWARLIQFIPPRIIPQKLTLALTANLSLAGLVSSCFQSKLCVLTPATSLEQGPSWESYRSSARLGIPTPSPFYEAQSFITSFTRFGPQFTTCLFVTLLGSSILILSSYVCLGLIPCTKSSAFPTACVVPKGHSKSESLWNVS